jgi:hypothetical protein
MSQSPFNFLPPSRHRPFRPGPTGGDVGVEPAGESLHPRVAAGRTPDDQVQIEIVEAMLNQGARHLDRQAVASPIIRGQFESKGGRPVLSSRLAETGAST